MADLPAGVPVALAPLARRYAVQVRTKTPPEDGRYTHQPVLTFVVDLVSAWQKGVVFLHPRTQELQIAQHPPSWPDWMGATIITIPSQKRRNGSAGQPWGQPASF